MRTNLIVIIGLEILPNVQAQPYLPGTYRVEENGVTLEYSFTYEFREDGLPMKRTTRKGGDIDVTTYKYY